MNPEVREYIVELESYFDTHNVPACIYRQFVNLVNEASDLTQDYIIYHVADVTINNENRSYFYYGSRAREPERDKEIMVEIADLLDGYIFYVVERKERILTFIRIGE